MFDELRRSSKTLMWFVMISFVALIFLAWGADFQLGSGGGPARAGEIGRVNGESIPAQKYQQIVESTVASLQQQGQQLNEQTAALIRNQAWENLVQETILRQEAEKQGLTVTDQEVAHAVLNQPLPELQQHPAFQTDGRFDLAKYQATLRSQSFDTRGLEQQYRYSLPMQKLQQRVLGAVVVSDAELWEEFRLRNEQAKVEYLLVNAGNFEVNASGIPADRLQSHYQEHQKEYEIPPQAIVEYVSFSKRQTADDSLATADLIRSLREDVVAGDDFLSIVAEMSQAPATQKGGTNAAWMSVSSLNPAIRGAVSALEAGALSEVVVEPRGFHLVRVEEKREDETAGAQVKIADLFLPLTASAATLSDVANRARSFREEVGGGDLAGAAQEFGLAVRETQPFAEEGLIPALGQAPTVQEFAFSNEVGAVSPPIDRPDSWMVIRVKERRDQRIPAFEEVEARVRNEVADLDRRQQAAAEAEKLLARLRAGETMETIATSDPSVQHKTIEGLARIGTRDFGSDPEVIGPIFAHGSGLISQPLTGRAGAYLVQVLETKPADRAAFDAQKTQLRLSEVQQRQNQLFATWLEELRDEAEVKDFRAGMF